MSTSLRFQLNTRLQKQTHKLVLQHSLTKYRVQATKTCFLSEPKHLRAYNYFTARPHLFPLSLLCKGFCHNGTTLDTRRAAAKILKP